MNTNKSNRSNIPVLDIEILFENHSCIRWSDEQTDTCNPFDYGCANCKMQTKITTIIQYVYLRGMGMV